MIAKCVFSVEFIRRDVIVIVALSRVVVAAIDLPVAIQKVGFRPRPTQSEMISYCGDG